MDSQAVQDIPGLQVSLVCPDLKENPEPRDSKEMRDILYLDLKEKMDILVLLVCLDFRDRKETMVIQVLQVGEDLLAPDIQGHQVLRVIQAPLAFPAPRVH